MNNTSATAPASFVPVTNRVACENKLFVIDTPEGINAFRLLTIKSGLRMEAMTGMRLTAKAPPCSVLARQILKAANKAAPANKAKLFDAYCDHLREIGVLS